MTPLHHPRWIIALTAALGIGPAVSAQVPPPLLENPDAVQPLLRREHWLAGLVNPSITGSEPVSNTPRVRLFRMMPGIPSDPLGLDSGDDLAGPKDDSAVAAMNRSVFDTGETNWLQIAIGQDNPWFDLRRPGDPGGVGYYRMNS